MKKIILDLCGGSGAWSKPYADAGYDVRLITLPKHDVRRYCPPSERVHGILAAPPCTEFSFALTEKRPRELDKGLEVVYACLKIIKRANPSFWALENPVGHLTRFLGAPAFIFQPWNFGDPWTKRTAIWGDFHIPKIQHTKWETLTINPNLYIRPGRKRPNMIWLHKSAKAYIQTYAPFTVETDADFRALTPQGFAKAFFEANP